MPQLLPEWAPQRLIQLCWPSQREYWGEHTVAAQQTHSQIIRHISQYQAVLLICSPDAEPAKIQTALAEAGAKLDNITIVPQANNDIWCRDYGPLSVTDNGNTRLLDFQFTGWGGKFPAQLDNAATQKLVTARAYALDAQSQALILEGGAIDYDGDGSLLTTTACLLNPNRNPDWSKADYESFMAEQMGIQRIHWLEQGYLAGDDTDSHVDMLARFAPPQDGQGCIIYQGCELADDEHYSALQKLAEELAALRDINGQTYRLTALPFPVARYDADGDRLPASYANFLITNQEVLVPAYGCEADELARSLIAEHFPSRSTVSINCEALIHQYGSLHCATMQVAA